MRNNKMESGICRSPFLRLWGLFSMYQKEQHGARIEYRERRMMDMCESPWLNTCDGRELPVIFVSGAGALKSRQEIAEKLLAGLLQNEEFLQTLPENVT